MGAGPGASATGTPKGGPPDAPEDGPAASAAECVRADGFCVRASAVSSSACATHAFRDGMRLSVASRAPAFASLPVMTIATPRVARVGGVTPRAVSRIRDSTTELTREFFDISRLGTPDV